MLTINKGSIENVLVSLEDVLSGVTDIMPFSPTYNFAPEYATGIDYTASPCDPGPTQMSVFCRVDATVDSGNTPGRYELFVRLTNPPEYPLVGPVRFKIQ